MKFTSWVKIKSGALDFENPYSRNNFLSFAKNLAGEWAKITLEEKEKPKSAEILGYYWGALLVSYVAHNKGLTFKTVALDELIKKGLVTRNEIDDAHKTFMLEYRPDIIFDLKGKPCKQAGEMKKMNNKEAGEYVTEVSGYMSDNGYPIPDPEEYKRVTDEINFTREKGIDYPVRTGETAF